MSKSSRHLRIHYSVTSPEGSGLWWVPKLHRWLTLDDPLAEGCNKTNSRSFHTKTKAFSHAKFLGHGAVIVRLNPNIGWRRKLGLGTWEITEWENNDEQASQGKT